MRDCIVVVCIWAFGKTQHGVVDLDFGALGKGRAKMFASTEGLMQRRVVHICGPICLCKERHVKACQDFEQEEADISSPVASLEESRGGFD